MSYASALRIWIESLPESGRYTFSLAEAEAVSGASSQSVQMTLLRLKKRGLIVSPRRRFFVLVPPEYRSAGCPPASWFIDELMDQLGRRYYVALLTASALHGAGHQQPMAFQVMADAPERDGEAGRVRIEFHASRLVESAATMRMQTETGAMTVGTAETTAFDLVRFPAAAGYWSQIATVLVELADEMDPDRLADGAARVARSDVQRLGWLLDFLGESELAESLARFLDGHRLVAVPLNSGAADRDAETDPRWRVVVNTEVEPDR